MFESLASTLMFGQQGSISGVQFEDILRVKGLEYRKGKTFKDVCDAFRKALDPKNGMAKSEVEVSMFGLYLSQVLKKIRP